ncbi:class I SAM-dependent methyltransferase [Allonocardiopsis opalescens]|uniref:class I SAM-dependent methyltransferase n=1 Tax=Allonocardiopsis opalescens TaxID=1144618 RepID=UPI000D083993|nr:class I SAM-dependent methyltransferase [Allonocardiopsis opalescens]
MPFDHNDHYHRLLLRFVPRGCRTALDVGCGTGRFARRLAGLGVAVDAVDPAAEVIAVARALSAGTDGGPRFEQGDITRMELPAGRYDYISCLASIHHVPFGTVAALREALAPGGVLVILGCYPERTAADLAWSLPAVPVNAAARLAVAAGDALRRAPAARTRVKAPVRPPLMPLRQVRAEAAALLPGCTIRRLLFWRYLLVFRDGARPAATDARA